MPGLLLFRGFAMRPVPSFHSFYPDVRAVRFALAAGAVAGLVVIAACTDGGKSISAPQSPGAPRMITSSSGGFGQARHVDLCVDPGSPLGDYTFSYTNENINTALPGNGSGAGPWDQGDGGDPASHTDFTAPTTIHGGGGLGAANTPAGICVRVVDRTLGDPDFESKVILTDGWSAATITAVSNTVSAVFSRVDCVNDRGVIPPQTTNPTNLGVWNSGTTYVAGNVVKAPAGSNVYFTSLTTNTNVPVGETTPPAPLTDWMIGAPCGSTSNPVRAFANSEHGTLVTFVFTTPSILEPCVLGYPYASANSRTSVDFNESEVLTGFQLISGNLHAWYTDEHALTLGVDSIYINNKAPKPDSSFGINTLPLIPDGNSYQIEKMTNPGAPTSATTAQATGSPIKVGRIGTTTKPVGQGNAIDPAGRPLFPSLYITDITGLADPAPYTSAAIRAGDWQYSSGIGNPNIPNAVYGTWKAAVITINNTVTPSVTKLVNRADPAKNHKIVGGAGVNPPALAIDNGYSTDIVWTVANLHTSAGAALIPGNRYRTQVIVHDGDQNKTGGDTGQACVNLTR